MDGNKHLFAISFADFLEIRLKVVTHLDGNLAIFIFSHDKNMIIYWLMNAWSHQQHMIDLLSCFDVCVLYMRDVWVTFLSLCLTQERSDVLLTTTAAGKVVTFVPVKQTMNWGPPLLNSTHLCSAHSSLSPPPVSKSSRRRCLNTPGQRNVCVRVSSDAWLCLSVFGLK